MAAGPGVASESAIAGGSSVTNVTVCVEVSSPPKVVARPLSTTRAEGAVPPTYAAPASVRMTVDEYSSAFVSAPSSALFVSAAGLNVTTQAAPPAPQVPSVAADGQVHVPLVAPPTAGHSWRVFNEPDASCTGAGMCALESRTSMSVAAACSAAQSTGSLKTSLIAASRGTP